MEFSFVQTQTFLHFLYHNGVLSEKQQASLFEDYSHSSSRKFIFILADFFKKLTPSDSYDLAFRLYTTWEKQKNPNNHQNISNNISNANPSNSDQAQITNNNIQSQKNLNIPLVPTSNSANREGSIKKKSENFKITIRNYKFSNVIKSFFERHQKKLTEMSFLKLKGCIKEKALNNYMVHLEDFKAELLNYNNINNPTFRASNLIPKSPLNEETSYEGPRPFLITPYKNKEDQILESSNKTIRENELKFSQSSQKKIPTSSSVHEKLYKEANLKKMNSLYLESIKKRNDLEGCTFRPNILKNTTEKNKENNNQAFTISGSNYSSITNNNNNNSNLITGGNSNYNSNGQTNNIMARYEKLYFESIQRKQNLIEKQKNEQENQLKECTFHPKTSVMPSSKPSFRENKENEENYVSSKGLHEKKRMRSFSTYEKTSNSLEMRDLNIVKTNNLRGMMSTKGSSFQHEILPKDLKRRSSIHENKIDPCMSNKKIQSIYYENDFFINKNMK